MEKLYTRQDLLDFAKFVNPSKSYLMMFFFEQWLKHKINVDTSNVQKKYEKVELDKK